MKKKRWIVLFLILLFVAPGCVAYYFYMHPQHLGATTNQGTLLTPPVHVNVAWTSNRWRLVAWCPNPDDTRCEPVLDALSRVRLALGRRLYDVDVVLLLPAEVDLTAWKARHHALNARLHDQDLHVQPLQNDADVSKLGTQAMIYLVDARQYAVLKYSLDAPLDAMYHDLKKLLTNG